MENLRNRIIENAQKWFEEKAPKYDDSQEVNFGIAPPVAFLQTIQESRLQDKLQKQSSCELEPQKHTHIIRMNLFQVIGQNPKLIILGNPGVGKTSSLYNIVCKYAEDSQNPIPLYLPLNLYSKEGHLKELIDCRLEAMDIKPHELEGKSLFFLLDGFDEIGLSERQELLKDIKKYKKDIRWVITSRKTVNLGGLRDWNVCELIEFDNEQIKSYLSARLDKTHAEKTWRDIQNQQILSLARVPLMLHFICELLSIDMAQALPPTKGELLDNIVHKKYIRNYTLCKKSPSQASTELEKFQIEKCLTCLGRLAHEVFKETGKVVFSSNLLRQILQQEVHHEAWDAVELFEKIGVIEKHELKNETLYSFWHQSLFEYFAGYYLKECFEQTTEKELFQKALPYFEFFKWDESMKIALCLCRKGLSNNLFCLALEQDIFLALRYFSSVEGQLALPTKQALKDKLYKLINNVLTFGQIAYFLPPHYTINCFSPAKYREILLSVGRSRCSYCVPVLIKNLRFNKTVAMALGEVGDPAAIPSLIIWTAKVKSFFERDIGIEALGKIASASTVPYFIELLNHKNITIREIAVKVLGEIGDTTIIPCLIDRLKNKREDEYIRRLAAIAISKIDSSPLVKMLTYKDRTVRESIIEALCWAENPAVIPYIIKYPENKDSDICKKIETFGELGDPSATPYLVKMLDNKDIEIRSAAIMALCKVNKPSVVIPCLIKQLDNEKDICMQLVINAALYSLGDSSAIFRIVKHFEEGNSNVRKFAAQILGDLGVPAIPYLVKQLDTEDTSLNYCIALALAKIGEPSAIPHLIRLLEVETPVVTYKCEEKHVERTISIPVVKTEAALALGNFDDASIIPHLRKQLDNKSIRLVMASVLCKLGDLSAISYLIDCLELENPREHDEASRYIKEVLIKISENKWPIRLRDKIKNLREKFIHFELGFEILFGWQEATQRRFIWFKEPLEQYAKEEKFEYKDKVDLNNKEYKYDLLGLKIDYVDNIDAPSVWLKLFSRNANGDKEIIAEKPLEFGNSEKNFAVLIRLAVAVTVDEKTTEYAKGGGWLYIKEPCEENKGSVGKSLYWKLNRFSEIRDFIEECVDVLNIVNLSKDEKRLLIRRKGGKARLAIPKRNIEITATTIENLKRFKPEYGAKSEGKAYKKSVQNTKLLIKDAIKAMRNI